MNHRLLGRVQVDFDLSAVRSCFRNKRVLITGAAGSIGSELSLALADVGCTQLALLDQFDHGILEIVERVRKRAPSLQVMEALCDVRDAGRLDTWMRQVEPDFVIHSAALKHVHLGERHAAECVLTNLVGAHNALAAAVRAGAEQFLLISSDKAAAPSCVMGATKRLAELHLSGFQQERASRTKLRSVRFGNVLGSQGSVLSRFAAQIDAGGPLELTHSQMERYFMLPQEAVGLILSVVALEDEARAACYYMEMGEPVRIMDMARELIADAGKPVDIEITGLRPGEKLKEQWFDEYETAAWTSLPNVFRVTPAAADAYVSSADVAYLEAIARTMENPIVRQRVFAHLDERLRREVSAAS